MPLGAKAGASLVGPRWVLPGNSGADRLVEGAGGRRLLDTSWATQTGENRPGWCTGPRP